MKIRLLVERKQASGVRALNDEACVRRDRQARAATQVCRLPGPTADTAMPWLKSRSGPGMGFHIPDESLPWRKRRGG